MTIFINSIDTVTKLIDNLKNNQCGLYLRFGDGDYNISQNKEELLCKPSTEFVYWMHNAMKIRDDNIIICVPHHCKELGTLESGMYPGNHEYSKDAINNFISILNKIGGPCSKIYTNVALSYCASHHPDLVVEFHKLLKTKNILFIGNKRFKHDFLSNLFGKNINTIYVPERDAYLSRDKVFSEFESLYQNIYKNYEFFIIIMASGCSGRAFSAELYHKYYLKKNNFFLIDYGSLLDYMNGEITRAYMNEDPPKKDYIFKNLL